MQELPPIKSAVSNIDLKRDEREKLRQQIRVFLARGGAIKRIPTGVGSEFNGQTTSEKQSAKRGQAKLVK